MEHQWGLTCWSLNHAHTLACLISKRSGMSDNRFSQVAGGMLPAAKCRFVRDMRYGDSLIRCIYLMSPAVFEEVCDRFEQAEQGLQLLLFAIINTFIF